MTICCQPINLDDQGVIVKHMRHAVFGNQHAVHCNPQRQIKDVKVRARVIRPIGADICVEV